MSETQKILGYRGYEKINQLNNDYIMKHTETGKLLMVFMCEDNLNIQILKVYVRCLEEIDIKHAIIIYKHKITPSSKKILASLKSLYEIELFTFDEMSIDYKNMKYFYEHIKLEGDEKQEIIDKYGLKIPTILKSDIIIRYLNYKKGDIIKILRKDNYIHYRIIK